MKELRKLKRLAVIFVVCVVCLIGVLIVQAIQQARINDEASKQHIEVCSMDNTQSLSWKRTDGVETVFTFDANHKLSEIFHDGQTFLPALMNEDLIRDTLGRLMGFSVQKTIDEPENLGVYGLDANYVTLTISAYDGTSHVIRVGQLTPEQTGIYVQYDTDSKVFIADYSYYQAIKTSFENFLSPYITSYDRSEISSVSFDRASTGTHWTMSPMEDYDNGVYLERRYKVTEPIEQENPSEQSIKLFEQILNFPVSQYIPIDKESFASYGLDQPEYHFAITKTNGEVVDLYLSVEIGGYYYGYISNNPYTFRILPQTLPGIDLSAFELFDVYVQKEFINDVRSATVQIKDTSFVFECEWKGDVTFDSDTVLLNVNKRNAKVITSNGDCYGLVLFESIFWMPVSDVDRDANPKLENVEASISITRADSKFYTIKLVPKDDNSYYCFINDAYTGYIVDRSVLYKDNGKKMEGFGIWDAYLLLNEAIENQDANKIYDRP